MIVRPVTRRVVVVGGLLGSTALSGCSLQQLTTRKVEDPEAADRARIARARDLSVAQLDRLDATNTAEPLRALLRRQITEFTRRADLPPVNPSATKVIGERELARTLQALALQADGGSVAALLASAAAGIDQALVR